MGKEHIVIVGSGGHASVVIDAIEKAGEYEVIGLIDSYKQPGEGMMGYEILGKETLLPELYDTHGPFNVCIAVGDNWQRHLLREKIVSILDDVDFPPIIHPSAQIAGSVKMGEGVVIMPGAVINSRTTIGDFSILNTNSSIDHDGILHAFGSLAPGVVAGGNVIIGAYSAIGIGSTIRHHVNIGDHVVVGAGSLVLEDCEGSHVYYGTPARVIRERVAGEPYL